MHLAHPLTVAMLSHQRVNDRRDAANLADLFRMGRLPEAWLAPPATWPLRELVRYRAKLVALRTGLKARVHSVLAKEGVAVKVSDLFGVSGNRLLDRVELAPAYARRVASLRQPHRGLRCHGAKLRDRDPGLLAGHRGYEAVRAIHAQMGGISRRS